MPKGVGFLLTLKRGKNESLRNYNKHEWETYNEIEECSKELVVSSYKLGLALGKRPWEYLTLNPPADLWDRMSWVKMFVRLEDEIWKAKRTINITL